MTTKSRLTTSILSILGAMAVALTFGCHHGDQSEGTHGTETDRTAPAHTCAAGIATTRTGASRLAASISSTSMRV